jgi:hypothetical protein
VSSQGGKYAMNRLLQLLPNLFSSVHRLSIDDRTPLPLWHASTQLRQLIIQKIKRPINLAAFGTVTSLIIKNDYSSRAPGEEDDEDDLNDSDVEDWMARKKRDCGIQAWPPSLQV